MVSHSFRRQEMVEYIRGFVEEHGYPPTVRDIQNGCNISSTSVVDHHL
ncbi:MAG TPA: repressor LexA, partial [Dehalococcoidia bacterium]|nr:repressor LexA [Dehalococcoidia bacterium]